MPVETRLFVKASLVWLCATFALGALLLALKAFGVTLPVDASVIHGHMGFVGWLVNLVMGIALWFLPVNRDRFRNNRGRYPIATVRWIFSLLNVGLLLRIAIEPFADTSGRTALTTSLLLLSAVMQLSAIVLFARIAWSRVRDASPKAQT